MNIDISDYKIARAQTKWEFSNEVLYRMCKENPKHDDEQIIIGKIMLIGRSYAAAIERRKNATKELTGDAFYFECVGPQIKLKGSEIDEKIENLKRFDVVNSENISEILSLHYTFTCMLEDLTALKKRSLASKYLHFHLPNLMFIYDSIVVENIRKKKIGTKEIRDLKKAMNMVDGENYDKEYYDFFIKALMLSNEIKTLDPNITPRKLDTYLLNLSKNQTETK